MREAERFEINGVELGLAIITAEGQKAGQFDSDYQTQPNGSIANRFANQMFAMGDWGEMG